MAEKASIMAVLPTWESPIITTFIRVSEGRMFSYWSDSSSTSFTLGGSLSFCSSMLSSYLLLAFLRLGFCSNLSYTLALRSLAVPVIILLASMIFLLSFSWRYWTHFASWLCSSSVRNGLNAFYGLSIKAVVNPTSNGSKASVGLIDSRTVL